MKTICLATNNAHKVEELQQLLAGLFEIKTLAAIGCFDEIAETGATFAENSLIKAQYIFENYGINCLADDSGLEVEALGGEPGVLSARYAGLHGDHEANINKLLYKLKDETNRNARFRTVLTLVLDDKIQHFEGIVKGQIIRERRGEKGFGYDPVFVPEGYTTTFAEMDAEQKNNLSHRGQAIQKLRAYLNFHD